MPIINYNELSYNRIKNNKKKLFYRTLIILIICTIFIIIIDMNMRPIIKRMTEYYGKNIASKVINSSVLSSVNELDYSYNNLVEIIKDNNSKIIGIESNIMMINKIQSYITYKIIENINNIDKQNMKIPIGSLIGSQYFYGRGPRINFVVNPNGNVKTEILSKFESAGINQTHHKIILNIEVNISILIPFYTTKVSIPSDFILSETVIVGDVPQYFTEVITSNEKTISDINDYGNPKANDS